MGKRVYMTLIKKERTIWDNDFVRGKISGVEYVVGACPSIPLATIETIIGDIITTVCYPRQYRKFKKIVEKLYPGLCEFDYKFTGDEAK